MNRLFIIALLAVVVFYGCKECIEATGEKTDRQEYPESFKKLKIDIPADVLVRQGDSTSILIQGAENLVQNIVLKQKGDKLIIDSENCFSGSSDIEILLITPTLSHLKINGSANVVTDDIFRTRELAVELNGSGGIDLSLYSDALDIEINGSGDARLKGTSGQLNIEIDGNGNVDAEELLTDDCEISISGSGDCRVDVQNSLKADISGSGTVTYEGKVEDIRSNINGSGELVRKN